MERSRPRVDSRRHLMRVAIDCFAHHGYRATSIDRIARSAGVTKGAIYHHFRDKEDLLYAAVRDRISEFEQRVRSETLPVRDTLAALRTIVAICREYAVKSNHRRFILTLMVEALENDAALSAEFREVMRRFRQFVEGIIRTGQEAGSFRADRDPRIAAALFTSCVMGAEIQYYQDPEAVNLDRLLNGFTAPLLAWLTGRGTEQAVEEEPWSVSS